MAISRKQFWVVKVLFYMDGHILIIRVIIRYSGISGVNMLDMFDMSYFSHQLQGQSPAQANFIYFLFVKLFMLILIRELEFNRNTQRCLRAFDKSLLINQLEIDLLS